MKSGSVPDIAPIAGSFALNIDATSQTSCDHFNPIQLDILDTYSGYIQENLDRFLEVAQEEHEKYVRAYILSRMASFSPEEFQELLHIAYLPENFADLIKALPIDPIYEQMKNFSEILLRINSVCNNKIDDGEDLYQQVFSEQICSENLKPSEKKREIAHYFKHFCSQVIQKQGYEEEALSQFDACLKEIIPRLSCK